MSRGERAKKVAAAPDPDLELEDRISALPDGILQHVLGFLPADEAVKTCVLARRWRHQWRSVRRLRIRYDKRSRSADDFVRLVNGLLLLRALGVALDEFMVSNCDPDIRAEIDIWIQHALLCKVRVMTIVNPSTPLRAPLISHHLKRLAVANVRFDVDCLDFATCPTLESLDIIVAVLCCSRILSQSVKHLRIINSDFSTAAICISMPSLISLRLINFNGYAPLLELMPSLQTAFVKPHDLGDACTKEGGYCCGGCAYCCGEDDHRGRSILLGGLSDAMYLELIAYDGMFIFKMDLRWCPIFSKLKTLLLNEWCVAIDLSALVCILEHSPILEKLILKYSKDA